MGNEDIAIQERKQRRRRRSRRMLMVLLALAVVIIAVTQCGSEEDDEAIVGPPPTPTPTPEAITVVAENEATENEATMDEVTEDEKAAWEAQAFAILEIEDMSFAGRARHLIHIIAPEAETREHRLATAITAATASYLQQDIENVAQVFLWESANRGWLLAGIVFAADQCGWTGDDCTNSLWSEARASAAQLPEDLIAIDIAYEQTSDLFSQPELRPWHQGVPVSQAGWDCFELLEVPAAGACFNATGVMFEGENKKWCDAVDAQWLSPDMGDWGYLEPTCAEDKHMEYLASALDMDKDEVKDSLYEIMTVYYDEDDALKSVELPDWVKYGEGSE